MKTVIKCPIYSFDLTEQSLLVTASVNAQRTPCTIFHSASDHGACGLVDWALDLRSKGLGFNSHEWSCVEVLSKLLLYCIGLPSSNGYLVSGRMR